MADELLDQKRLRRRAGDPRVTDSGREPDFTEGEVMSLRNPHPELLDILDPRPLLDDAAVINALYNAWGG